MKLITRVRTFFKEVRFIMAMVYATLIVKGVKEYSDVPPTLQPQVKQILIDLEVPELAEVSEGEAA
jgi:hypothetical protein